MTWRLARDEDVPAIQEFLNRHVQSSMFTLAKLHEGGLSGIKIWMLGNVRGILAVTTEELVFPEMPGASENEVKLAAELLRTQTVTGIIGEASQSRRLMKDAVWADKSANVDHDEPAFSLELKNLTVPELPGAELVPLDGVDRATVVAWRQAYCMGAIGLDPDQALERAERDIESFLIRDSHRVLKVDGTPVATTDFNAAIPDTVQIAGVYTPPPNCAETDMREWHWRCICKRRAHPVFHAPYFARHRWRRHAPMLQLVLNARDQQRWSFSNLRWKAWHELNPTQSQTGRMVRT